ncbi:hypothetical protein [Clostridium estertheticum]|uniref:hypothetical protein n=1 Tax=Clostridium estertheticum TaxID=238834 RepID=UPI001C7E1901|nr:hypothetical protein [Clostridium estertheticum]MBX4266143.1 hypothetical protein [Clostridium estertheticum]WLC87949.1 hypothetical protein KTC95_18240 [Clostridium estertheticum]
MKKINKMCLKKSFLVMTILFAVLFYSFHNIEITNSTNCYFLYKTIFYKNIVLCIIMPLWFWLLSNIDELYYNYLILLKFKDIQQWLYEKIKIMAAATFIYVLTLNILVLSIIVYLKIEMPLDFVIYMVIGFLLQYVGFLILGIFSTFLFLKLSNVYSSYGFTYFLLLFLSVVSAKLKLGFLDLLNTMYLSSKISINFEQAIQLSWMCFIFIGIYRLTVSVGRKEDKFWNTK